MRLTELDNALELAIPLQFEITDAYRAISDAPEPTMRELYHLGGELRRRGYVKERIMRNGVRLVLWRLVPNKAAECLEQARIDWQRCAGAELAARNRYHALQRASH